MNDGIDSSLTLLHYASIDNAVAVIQCLGSGTVMDLKAAYCYVPVHPDDRHLLGTCWDNCIYINTVLPFGLHSAPKVFSAVADRVLWAMYVNGMGSIGLFIIWTTFCCLARLVPVSPRPGARYQDLHGAGFHCSYGATQHKLPNF